MNTIPYVKPRRLHSMNVQDCKKSTLRTWETTTQFWGVRGAIYF